MQIKLGMRDLLRILIKTTSYPKAQIKFLDSMTIVFFLKLDKTYIIKFQ